MFRLGGAIGVTAGYPTSSSVKIIATQEARLQYPEWSIKLPKRW